MQPGHAQNHNAHELNIFKNMNQIPHKNKTFCSQLFYQTVENLGQRLLIQLQTTSFKNER